MCREAKTVEVRPLGEHPWKKRDEMKQAVLTQDADFIPWHERLLYKAQDCVEQAVEVAIAGTKKIAQSVKQAAKNWWQKNSPAIGVKDVRRALSRAVASAAIAGLVLITDVAEKLGG